jgi:hypothetical protein
MTVSISDIYRSSSGDCWILFRTTDPKSALVRHVSGGRTSDTDVVDFLSTNGPGPRNTLLCGV